MTNETASTEAELVVLGFLAGYRGETVGAYSSDLRWWALWCARIDVDLLAVSRAHIESYAAAIQDEQGLRPASVARRLTTVCGFYRHCTAEGLVTRNPVSSCAGRASPRRAAH